MKIGFFGTPVLAAKVLEDLLREKDVEISFVVTNPDRAIGRDQKLQPTPVKQVAISQNIKAFTPEKIRGNEQFLNQIGTLLCDYFVVVAYGKILPKELLDLPRKQCINVHGSILPKYRGASPIQSALLHGEKETGVTIMQMSEGMDEGDIILTEIIPIDSGETSGTLFEKFEQISGNTLIRALRGLELGELTPVPQDDTQATYCTKIEKENGFIDWFLSAEDIYHKWQAYTPWPGIFTIYDGKRLLLEKVGSMKYEVGRDEVIGSVIKLSSGEIGIICGEGILTLEQVKLEGKKSQSIQDFVNGRKEFLSYKFS